MTKSPMTAANSGDAAPAILALGLVKQYGSHRVVDGIGFSLPAGQTLALIGHNGAGKTTLMKLVLGLVRPSSGELRVLGEQPAMAGLEYRRQIGFLPENVAFHNELTGQQTLEFYARLKRVDLKQCTDLLENLGLTFAAGRRVKTYSKGMRQRLGLAQALLGHPRLLLLDEPTTGLDPDSRVEFFRIVQELSARGVTVIISSHILTELEAKTGLVAIMNMGRLTAFGPLELLRREANLPVKFSVTTTNGARVAIESLRGLALDAKLSADRHGADIWCRVEDKMASLARLAALGPVISDVDIRPPGLDEIYRHFSARPAAPGEDSPKTPP